jgi:hypothetical protein
MRDGQIRHLFLGTHGCPDLAAVAYHPSIEPAKLFHILKVAHL